MHPNDFLDWLSTTERVFKYDDLLDSKKAKLVVIKLKKDASFLWNNVKRQREREGKSKIITWDKMKCESKRKYLSSTYRQHVFMKIHNLRQKTMSVEKYTMEFDNLMLKSELEELKKHSIAGYLGRLNFDIASVVNL